MRLFEIQTLTTFGQSQRQGFIDSWEEDEEFDDEDEAAEKFDELYEMFDDFSDPFTVYRGMAVTKEWITSIQAGDTPPLGIHWTYDKDAATSELAGHSHDKYINPKDRLKSIPVVFFGLT